jgi:hypothetical protein
LSSEHNLTGKIQTDIELEAWLSKNAQGLRRLRVRNGHLTDQGAQIIAAHCSNLEELDLGDNLIGDEGALALSLLPRLRAVNLYGNQVGDIGAAELISRLPLQELNLCGNRISVSGLEAIARYSTGLQKLHLGFLSMGDSGAEVLQSKTWPALKELNVRLNALSAKVVPGFVDANRFPSLRYLGIEENPLGDELADIFLSPSPLLKTINFGGVGLTEQAAIKLLKVCPEKTNLLLHDNDFHESMLQKNHSLLDTWTWAEGLYRTRLMVSHIKSNPPTEYIFETGWITIGRVQGNELVHPMGNISRQHAALLISRSGRVFAFDLKSTNGSQINGTRIIEPTEFRVGDIFYPGGIMIKLKEAPESILERTREGCAAYHPQAFVPW